MYMHSQQRHAFTLVSLLGDSLRCFSGGLPLAELGDCMASVYYFFAPIDECTLGW